MRLSSRWALGQRMAEREEVAQERSTKLPVIVIGLVFYAGWPGMPILRAETKERAADSLVEFSSTRAYIRTMRRQYTEELKRVCGPDAKPPDWTQPCGRRKAPKE